jgi:hypothetical protein
MCHVTPPLALLAQEEFQLDLPPPLEYRDRPLLPPLRQDLQSLDGPA